MGTSCLEIGDASLNFIKSLIDELGHVLARPLAAIADAQDPSDLVKGEARRLPMANERQPLKGSRLVIAIARRCARRQRNDARLLPEPNRLGRDAGMCRQLTDFHVEFPLDIPVDWKVWPTTEVEVKVLYFDGCLDW